MRESGLEALQDAAAAVGFAVEAAPPGAGDLAVVAPSGRRITMEVKAASLASADSVERLIAQSLEGRRSTADMYVLVADRVTAHARERLQAAGWGWLDLRGQLHLVSADIFVHADIHPLGRNVEPGVPLQGRVGREVAAFMLLDPDQPVSVRGLARGLARAPSSVSEVIGRMRSSGLVDENLRPVVPDLFWELVDWWEPKPLPVGRAPSPGLGGTTGSVNEALRLGFDDIETTTGWALTDTLAAIAYGAPLNARSDHPPDYYVPDHATLRRAAHLLGPAPDRDTRAATIQVPPVALACSRRIDWPGTEWPLARPLFVALDLARDPGRGREILRDWTPPPEAGRRVW